MSLSHLRTRGTTVEKRRLDAPVPPSDVDEEALLQRCWSDAVPDLPGDLALRWAEEGMTDFDWFMAESMEAPAWYAWLLRECLTWCYLTHGRWEVGAATALGREIRAHLDGWLPYAREETIRALRQAWVDAGDGTAP